MPFIMELSLAGSVFQRPAPAAQWILPSFPAGISSMQTVFSLLGWGDVGWVKNGQKTWKWWVKPEKACDIITLNVYTKMYHRHLQVHVPRPHVFWCVWVCACPRYCICFNIGFSTFCMYVCSLYAHESYRFCSMKKRLSTGHGYESKLECQTMAHTTSLKNASRIKHISHLVHSWVQYCWPSNSYVRMTLATLA